MKRLFILLLLSMFFVSCNYRPKDLLQVSEYCFVVEDYVKTICLEVPYDSLHPILYIDKNKYEMEDRKFSDLKMYIMMVVEIEGNDVVFSNINYSVKVKFHEISDIEDKGIKVQDMYYIIIQREHLSDSKVVIKSNGQKEELYEDGEDVYDGVEDMSNMIDMMDPEGGGYDDIEDGGYEEQGSGYDVDDP